MVDATLPPFPGFRPQGFRFLRDLKANNDRAWFKPRKGTYEDELQWPMQCLVAQLGSELNARGVPLAGDPGRALFRIYRDTRFSANKEPYKPYVAAYLSRSGDRKEDGGLYIHVGHDESFFGTGFWNSDKGLVARWRERLATAPGEFLEAVAAVEAAGLQVRMQDPLKRMPRGYESAADGPAAEYLKAKGLFATRNFSEEEAGSPALAETIADTTVATLPLLQWGWALMK